MRQCLCITSIHIIILPCALFYTHSRKPLIRKTQPAALPVASLLHQESCDQDFTPSHRFLPPVSPPASIPARSRQRGCDHILPSCRSGIPALTMHCIMMKDAFDLTTAENMRERSACSSVDEIKISLDVSRISLWGSHQM